MANKFPYAVIAVAALAIVGFAVVRLGSRGENISPELQKDTVAGENPAPVPPPSAEDFLRVFIALVDEGRVEEAVAAMSWIQTESPGSRESWSAYWGIFDSLKPLAIKSVAKADSAETFEVALEAKINTRAANAPIPNYGWQDGVNQRWFRVVKENGGFKIGEIATGP